MVKKDAPGLRAMDTHESSDLAALGLPRKLHHGKWCTDAQQRQHPGRCRPPRNLASPVPRTL